MVKLSKNGRECVLLEKDNLNEETCCESSCCCSSCGCGSAEDNKNEKVMLLELLLGGFIFIVTEWFGLVPESYKLYSLVLAYLLLGWHIIKEAVENIFKGKVFDENFLMTIATLGAFYIKAWEEAVGVMFFYRIGEYFEHCAVEKSRSQIMTAVDMRPEVVQLVVDGEVKNIPAADAKVGDILLVRVGDRIPLDGIVVEGESLVDTSPVTGEPVPVKVKKGDKVLSGCVNTIAMLKLKVEKVLAESLVTKILDSVENAAGKKPVVEKFITRFARIYTPLVVAIALFVAVVPSLLTGEWEKWIYTALTFLVISCPCALVLSIPLAFYAGIGTVSKQGALFKSGIAMETLKKVKAVVMDKTGTITKGDFVLHKLEAIEGVSANVLLKLCASAELASSHPIAVSIVAAARERGLTLEQPDQFEEFAGEGIVAHFGKSVVLCGNAKLLQRFQIASSVAFEESSGSEVFVAQNGKYFGRVVIGDSMKEDAKAAIALLKQQGFVTALLTGDNYREAAQLAKDVGIDMVKSKLLPQEKLEELTALRKKYGAVLFVGDGINDAPSLALADVSAAMGTGADVAIEAADIVFMRPEVSAIPKAFAIAKETDKIAWQNIVLAVGVKVVIILAGILGYASMWTAVFADTGVAMLCVFNSVRILYKKF